MSVEITLRLPDSMIEYAKYFGSMMHQNIEGVLSEALEMMLPMWAYPTPAEIEAAKQRGVSPGGDIMVHGLPNGLGFIGSLHHIADWTAGCIAITNEEIEEIWNVVDDGTVIEIRP